MNSPVFDPENYCPICGIKIGSEPAGRFGHQCPPATLKAIDAARERDYVQVRQPHISERLVDGFGMLNFDETALEDDEPDPDRLFS